MRQVGPTTALPGAGLLLSGVMFHAIPSFGPHCGRGPPCAVPSFRPLAAQQGLPPFALHTLVASVAAALAFMPLGTSAQEKATTTPQTATLPVVEVTEGSATPNGKLSLDTPWKPAAAWA